MEELMIRRLDFSLRSEPPLTFLERYFRVFGIDQHKEDQNAKAITELAHELSRYTQSNSVFLDFKPSHNAAACLLLAFNLSQSSIADDIGVKKVPELKVKSLLLETQTIHSMTPKEQIDPQGPLQMWNKSVEELTSVK